MSAFKTYKVQVTFEMATPNIGYGTDDFKKLVQNDVLSGVQNKIRLCLNDVNGILFTNPELTVLEDS
jgi:hypothetical protein